MLTTIRREHSSFIYRNQSALYSCFHQNQLDAGQKTSLLKKGKKLGQIAPANNNLSVSEELKKG